MADRKKSTDELPSKCRFGHTYTNATTKFGVDGRRWCLTCLDEGRRKAKRCRRGHLLEGDNVRWHGAKRPRPVCNECRKLRLKGGPRGGPRKEYCLRGHKLEDPNLYWHRLRDGKLIRGCKLCSEFRRRRKVEARQRERRPRMTCKRGHPVREYYNPETHECTRCSYWRQVIEQALERAQLLGEDASELIEVATDAGYPVSAMLERTNTNTEEAEGWPNAKRKRGAVVSLLRRKRALGGRRSRSPSQIAALLRAETSPS